MRQRNGNEVFSLDVAELEIETACGRPWIAVWTHARRRLTVRASVAFSKRAAIRGAGTRDEAALAYGLLAARLPDRILTDKGRAHRTGPLTRSRPDHAG